MATIEYRQTTIIIPTTHEKILFKDKAAATPLTCVPLVALTCDPSNVAGIMVKELT